MKLERVCLQWHKICFCYSVLFFICEATEWICPHAPHRERLYPMGKQQPNGKKPWRLRMLRDVHCITTSITQDTGVCKQFKGVERVTMLTTLLEMKERVKYSDGSEMEWTGSVMLHVTIRYIFNRYWMTGQWYALPVLEPDRESDIHYERDAINTTVLQWRRL